MKSTPTIRFGLLAAAAIGVAAFIWLRSPRPVRAPDAPEAEATVPGEAAAPAPALAATAPPQTEAAAVDEAVPQPSPSAAPEAAAFSGVVPNASFQLRPFRPAITNATHAWTAEDGRDTNVIRQLAHNNLEYDRMVDENARILRRQLVYRNDPVAAVIERSKLTDEPVRRLTLPGLDGREVAFEVKTADLQPSGMQGMISGYIPDQPDSMVTVAFKGRREAFTVLSPSDNLYLVAEPREPGEVIVKSIDPEVYAAGQCGNP